MATHGVEHPEIRLKFVAQAHEAERRMVSVGGEHPLALLVHESRGQRVGADIERPDRQLHLQVHAQPVSDLESGLRRTPRMEPQVVQPPLLRRAENLFPPLRVRGRIARQREDAAFERSAHKGRSSVYEQSVSVGRNRTHPEHLAPLRAVSAAVESDRHLVEVGRKLVPQFHVAVQPKRLVHPGLRTGFEAARHAPCRHLLPGRPVGHLETEFSSDRHGRNALQRRGDLNLPAPDIRRHVNGDETHRSEGCQAHFADNAVPDNLRVIGISVRQIAHRQVVFLPVVDPDGQPVAPRGEPLRQVVAVGRRKAPLARPGLHAVDPDVGGPNHPLQSEFDAAAVPCLRNLHFARIPRRTDVTVFARQVEQLRLFQFRIQCAGSADSGIVGKLDRLRERPVLPPVRKPRISRIQGDRPGPGEVDHRSIFLFGTRRAHRQNDDQQIFSQIRFHLLSDNY